MPKNKFFETLYDLPGHKAGDSLISAGNYYVWESDPIYSLNKEIVENYPDWFKQVYPEFKNGDDIWFISLNGLIIHDEFDRSKHTSLVEFGNIFRNEKSASEMHHYIKEVFEANKNQSSSST
jgi:hypothetical protein